MVKVRVVNDSPSITLDVDPDDYLDYPSKEMLSARMSQIASEEIEAFLEAVLWAELDDIEHLWGEIEKRRTSR